VLDFISENLDGAPVTVSFEGLPSGLTISPVSGASTGSREGTVSGSDTTPEADYKVTVYASANANGTTATAQTTFQVHVDAMPLPVVDIVFALDTTGSMEPFIEGVRDGIGDFVSILTKSRIDAQVGLLAFHDWKDKAASQLMFSGEPFTKDVGLFRSEVSRLSAGSSGLNREVPESTSDALVQVSKLNFRKQAIKVILVITDAPPLEPDQFMPTLADAVRVLRSNRIDQVHLAVRVEDLNTFSALKNEYPKGSFFDLNEVIRRRKTFASILPELSKVIATAAVASRPTAQLAAPPPKAALASQGLQSSQAYDARAQGQLLFAISVWTAAIAAAISLALAAVQYLSLNRRPSANALLLSLGGGALAGLVGGAVGQGLFMLASGNPLAAALFRVVGWAALGGLAGCGLAFVVPNLQKPHGLVGGLLGGGIGAVGYMLAAYIGLGDFVGRLAGALILGFFIGLMVALVEAVLRRAWLEVRFGGGEVIAVNLGPEPVKVGGDGQQCAVWARGAPPVALRYWLRGPQVFCHDVATGQERAVAGGDYRRAGGVEVTVRTSASGTAQATGTKPTVLVDEEPEVAVRPRAIRPTTQPPPVAPTPPKQPPPVAPTPTQPPPVAPPQTRPAAPAAKSHRCPACGIGVEKPHGICPSCGEMY